MVNAIKICKADKYVPLSELQANPNNSRTISDDRLSQLKESLKRFGVYKPLRVHGNIIIGGNQTYRALTELTADGWILDKVPVVELEGYSDEELKLILLNDNNSYGDWGRDALSTLMCELTDVALAAKALGYETYTIVIPNNFLTNKENKKLTFFEKTPSGGRLCWRTATSTKKLLIRALEHRKTPLLTVS